MQMLKQVFWLTEYELRVENKNPPYSWKGIAKLTPKTHIIHDTLELKDSKTKRKDKNRVKRYIKKLETHVKRLDKKYHNI